MKFGSTPVDEACGHILAHSQKLTDGTLKKGRLLDAQDIQRLRACGVNSVVSACLDEDDVGEDEAAETLAIALAGTAEGIRVAAPFTGRSNLFASRRALMSVDAQRINAMNRVHESLTVATLPSPMVVDPKQMLATVKVIAFSVPRIALNTALDIVAGDLAAKHIVEVAQSRRSKCINFCRYAWGLCRPV